MPKLKLEPAATGHSRIMVVVVVYALFGASWILLSDQVVALLFSDKETLVLASVFKDWFFIGVTTLLLYGLLRRWFGGAAESLSGHVTPRSWRLSATMAIVIVAATAGGIAIAARRHEETIVAQLQTIAQLKVEQITDWLAERDKDAEFMHTSVFFATNFRQWQHEGDTDAGAVLQSRLRQWQALQGFSAVTLLDADARRVWSTDTAPRERATALSAAIEKALDNREKQRAGLYLGVAGTPRIDYVIPLTALPGPAPMVVLHADPRAWLFSTLQTWPIASATGETLLIRREGNDIVYLNELRHRHGMAMRLRIPAARANLLAATILDGSPNDTGRARGVDYRDVPVQGVGLPVPGTDWLLIAKVDQAEIYELAYADAAWIALAGVLALLVSGGSLYVMRQREHLGRAVAARELQAEKVRALQVLASIADSSEDAIFAKDLEGRYLVFNRAACEFVGRPVEAVLGNDDRNIFPAAQAEALQAIGRRVVATGQIETNEEILDTPAGQRVFLATKGPLRDRDDRIVGTFGISRDITERKRTEEELKLWAESFQRSELCVAIGDPITNLVLAVNPAFAAARGYQVDELIGESVLSIYPPDRVAEITKKIAEINSAGHGVFESEHLCKDGRRFPVLIDVTVLRAADGTPTRRVVYALDITDRKQAEEALLRQAAELRARNVELERFNRAMIGRELAMIELKRQVNTLSQQLGLERPYALGFSDSVAAPPAAGDTH